MNNIKRVGLLLTALVALGACGGKSEREAQLEQENAELRDQIEQQNLINEQPTAAPTTVAVAVAPASIEFRGCTAGSVIFSGYYGGDVAATVKWTFSISAFDGAYYESFVLDEPFEPGETRNNMLYSAPDGVPFNAILTCTIDSIEVV